MNKKYCPQCTTMKLVDDFPVNRSRPDGRGGWCRMCMREATRQWKLVNQDIVRLHAKIGYHNKKLAKNERDHT